MIGRKVLHAAVFLLAIGLIAFRALSVPQGKEQRQCVETMNGNGAKVGKTQAKEIVNCVRDASRGALGPLPLTGQLEACTLADAKNRVFSIKQKTQVREGKRCVVTLLPDFGVPALSGTYSLISNSYSSVVNATAIKAQLALAHDILGYPADNAAVNGSSATVAAKCQRTMLAALQNCRAERIKTFIKCKKLGLKNSSIGSPSQLETQCLMTAGNPANGQPDPKGKIAKRCETKFATVLTKSCPGVNLATVFRGLCGGTPSAFTTCLKGRAACRTCQELNRNDDLNRSCDLFDDGANNGSCPNVLPQCGDGVVDAPTEACDDGNTTNGDCCSSTCQFESSGAVCGDQMDDECTNPDTCDGAGTCQANHEASGSACGDPTSNDCTAADTCNGAGVCQANHLASGTGCGDPSDTDCTDPDTCDGSGTCLDNNVSAGASCGDPSNTDCSNPDTCDASGMCQPNHRSAGTTCTNDGSDCTTDVCNASGTCTHPSLPSGTACGNPADTDCTNPDTCNSSGVCQSNDETAGSSCTSDGNDCTSDVCNASGTCTHPNVSPGTACGSPASTACTAPDTCNASGVCQANNASAGTACTSDGNQCTDDLCDGTGACTHPNTTAGTACADDGSECTNDQCNGGGSCIHPAKTAGTACSSDGNICTDDQCNGAGTCAHLNNSAPCSDGLFCNGADTCSGGNCAAHAGNPCPGPDGDGNCAESCNESADNCTANDPNGSFCNDGSACNGSDTCSGGTCSIHSDLCCGTVDFTFTVNSNTGGVFDSAEWPGGTAAQTSAPGCSVTINRPNDNIDLVCTLAAPFSVNSFTGFSSCFGTGGEDGDGCQPNSCPPAGVGSCCSGRPSCSAALNGSGSAKYFVRCIDP